MYASRYPLRIEQFSECPSTRHAYTIINLRKMDGEDLLASDDWADN